MRSDFLMFMKLLVAACLLCGCISYPSQGNASQDGDALLFELPSFSKDDIIIQYHDNYVVSYNEETKVANWVAYELTSEETYGTGDRKGMSFTEDTEHHVRQASYLDYKGGIWRKGHLAPAADFKTNNDTMLDTFYYTNCAPQADRFNNSQWNELENRVRGWARHYGSIYVVTGPVIGTNANGTIGENRVVIPDAYFKALCIYKDGTYYTVAFLMANSNDCPSYRNSALTINKLEEITGLNFFPSLNEAIEDVIDPSVWGAIVY